MNMKQAMPLNHIFALLQQGDKKGLELLYNDYYNKMYGIAFSVVKNEAMSEDVVHNAMYKFMTMYVKLFPSSNEGTWLFSVVKNEALKLLRKERKTIPLDQIGELGLEDKSISDYVDMDEFKSMIKPLNDKQKMVVSLKILGGYTHKEIAKMLNKPIGTILWLYNTSIKKLKVVLSSILSSIFVLLGSLIVLVYCIVSGGEVSDIGNSHTDTGITTESLFNIMLCHIVIIGCMLLVLIVSFILFYRKSEKIPIKSVTKNI